jgi:hypothetical protein
VEAEKEIAAKQRRRNALTLRAEPTAGIHEDRIGEVAAAAGGNSFDTIGCGFFHEGGEPFQELRPVGAGPRISLRYVEVGIATAIVVLFPAVFAGQEHLPVLSCSLFHPIVSGAALAAEHQRKQRLFWFAGLGAFLGHLQVALRWRLNGCPYSVAAGEELMQSKSENGKATGRTPAQLGSF